MSFPIFRRALFSGPPAAIFAPETLPPKWRDAHRRAGDFSCAASALPTAKGVSAAEKTWGSFEVHGAALSPRRRHRKRSGEYALSEKNSWGVAGLLSPTSAMDFALGSRFQKNGGDVSEGSALPPEASSTAEVLLIVRLAATGKFFSSPRCAFRKFMSQVALKRQLSRSLRHRRSIRPRRRSAAAAKRRPSAEDNACSR